MTNVVAIHQPNFFPWLGYFDKIAASDAFVFLDDVQFQKTGGGWSNRVKLLIGGEPRWATAAIDRNYNNLRTIREMKFISANPWRTKLLKSIETNYRRHAYYDETMELVTFLLLNSEVNVAEYNIHTVSSIAHRLGIKNDRFYRSSNLPHHGSSNELLCSITSLIGGSVYMCGGGAEAYQDESVFKERGLSLRYQNFLHPIYPQRGRMEFTHGLSIIDALMNIGFEGVRNFLRQDDK